MQHKNLISYSLFMQINELISLFMVLVDQINNKMKTLIESGLKMRTIQKKAKYFYPLAPILKPARIQMRMSILINEDQWYNVSVEYDGI